MKTTFKTIFCLLLMAVCFTSCREEEEAETPEVIVEEQETVIEEAETPVAEPAAEEDDSGINLKVDEEGNVDGEINID